MLTWLILGGRIVDALVVFGLMPPVVWRLSNVASKQNIFLQSRVLPRFLVCQSWNGSMSFYATDKLTRNLPEPDAWLSAMRPFASGVTNPGRNMQGMRKFKSTEQAQRFLAAHAAVYNWFNLGRHLVSAENYRYFRLRAFASWQKAAAIWI
jgi:hypothetical protein